MSTLQKADIQLLNKNMIPKQITEYLNKYRLINKKLLANHILELKRNTIPNTPLISNLVWALEDNSFFPLRTEGEENKPKEIKSNTFDIYPSEEYLLLVEKYCKDDVITNVNKGEIEMINWFKNPLLIITEEKMNRMVENVIEKEENLMSLDSILSQSNTNSTRHKSKNGECHLTLQEPTLKTLDEIRREEDFRINYLRKYWNSQIDNRKNIYEVGKKEVEYTKSPLECFKGINDAVSDVVNDAVIEGVNEGTIEGVKQTEGKLNYELDWGFIQQMAERMGQNKGKYEPYNWTLKMDVEKLKQSLLRHVIEVMKGDYTDDNRQYGHLESIALNALFINYQLKNK